jgi:EpsI family protein
MTKRLVILIICFLAGSAYLASATQTEPTMIRESLSRFPLEIGDWRGRDDPLDDRILEVLGVNDYLSRSYRSRNGSLGLYIGFYETQRQGSTIHSPLNCLPGAGWNPVSRAYMTVTIGAQDIEVNRITIQKGLDRQVVLYWYQAHGRVVANEYWGKIYTVVDAMRLNRTDAAMVRVVVPVAGSDTAAENAAEATAVDFVKSIFPLLSRHLPQ